MSYTTIEQKAIKLYGERNNAVPQLSARPMVRFMVRFMVRDSHEILERHIITLVTAFEAAKKEDIKERARLKRQEERRGKR